MKRLILSRLNPAQRKRISALCGDCRQAEPIQLTLPLPEAGEELTDERFFLLYEQGRLVSLLHLFYPDGQVGELIGFTHPEFRRKNYFTKLLSLAVDYAEQLGLKQLYLISDGNSSDAREALKALELEEEYAEYMLEKPLTSASRGADSSYGPRQPSLASEPRQLSPTSEPRPLSLASDARRLSVSESVSPIPELFSEIFSVDREQCDAYLADIGFDDHISTYVLKLDKLLIGQAQLTVIGDMAYLSGFGILPAYRSRGYGAFFLRELERILDGQSLSRLTLQVSSQNKTALSLYRKDGFRELETLRYYPLF